MPEFKYTSKQEMTPRFGQKFATTYYRFTGAERLRLHRHMRKLLEDFFWSIDDQTMRAPLRGFPRQGRQPNYSAYDILEDLYDYVVADSKDVPSGMLGRWNRLSEGMTGDWEITPVSSIEEHTPRVQSENFARLFRETK